ncbi:hypothetical protein [Pseudonocardia endophytica]|uniref:Uncharacterized protein n=1 Tax=Pseudonocardia endophytica TaxID=401976 RepID=A0A4R1HU91_PSEEN|nr:hypothetical protein [Pseudonocardia endophytica]TCK24923.1 hypothetical protein EV378_0718 [Pseudonocardia endophytica]
MADSSAVYAFLDDGPHAGETVRIDPEADGKPPREFVLADPDGLPRVYELRGPHHNDEWWIFRLVRGDVAGQDS